MQCNYAKPVLPLHAAAMPMRGQGHGWSFCLGLSALGEQLMTYGPPKGFDCALASLRDPYSSQIYHCIDGQNAHLTLNYGKPDALLHSLGHLSAPGKAVGNRYSIC